MGPLPDQVACHFLEIFQFLAKLADLLHPVAVQGLQFVTDRVTDLRQDFQLFQGLLLQEFHLKE
jgi:hypothetical protein